MYSNASNKVRVSLLLFLQPHFAFPYDAHKSAIMVQRPGLKKALAGSKPRASKRSSAVDEERLEGMKRKMGGRKVQKRGELDLDNPSIPHELDEDIDDDMAFNSDDEAKYGAFFAKVAARDKEAKKDSKKGKGKKKGNKKGDDNEDEGDDLDDEFDKLNAVGEEGVGEMGFSDDSRDEIDLSEMLDSKEDRQRNRSTRRTKKEGRRKGPGEKLTRESESILGPLAEGLDKAAVKKPAGLPDLLRTAPQTSSKNRLEAAVHNKKTLLTEDVDDYTKAKTSRENTRAAVAGQLKKYTSIIKAQKETRHLKFPLSMPDSNPVPGTMGSLANALTAKKGNANPIADKMNSLLRASGLANLAKSHNSKEDDQDQIKFGDGEEDDGEAEESNKLSVGYMAKLKSMLSYEVMKRKRLNKIKSKTYRRILRKEKDREADRRQKALELLNPEAARARLQAKMEKLRAEERATQKHKNTSKWVKHAKQFSKFDTDTKDAINEQHAIRQRLMSKMDEEAGAEMAEAADEMSQSSEEEMRVDELLTGEKNAESILWQGADAEDAADVANMTPVEKARKELLSMGFMAKAKERAQTQFRQEIGALKEDIDRYHKGLDPLHAPSGMLTKGSKKARAALEDEEDAELQMVAKDAAEGDAEELKAIGASSVSSKHQELNAPSRRAGKSTGAAGRKSFAESHQQRAVDIALKKRSGITADSNEENREDDNGDDMFGAEDFDDAPIEEDAQDEAPDRPQLRSTRRTSRKKDTDATVYFSEFAGDREQKDTRKKKKSTSTRHQVLPSTGVKRTREEVGDDVEGPSEDKLAIESSQDLKRDQQEYLIARAFAADEVDEDFLKAKEFQTESIMKPVDKNNTLPGWGEWGGEDERLNARHKAKLEVSAMERKIKKSNLMKARADAQLENVIINHDVDLIADRHMLHMVPRPFSNGAEFSRSMRQPLGPEWNSSLSFKEGTQPRITTAQGVAIDPLDLTSQKKKAKTIRRKVTAKKRKEA